MKTIAYCLLSFLLGICALGAFIGPRISALRAESEFNYYGQGQALYAGVGIIVRGRENGRSDQQILDGLLDAWNRELIKHLEKGVTDYPHGRDLESLAVGLNLYTKRFNLVPLPSSLASYDEVDQEASEK